VFHAFRSGAEQLVDVNALEGIITFPSFHASAAVLLRVELLGRPRPPLADVDPEWADVDLRSADGWPLRHRRPRRDRCGRGHDRGCQGSLATRSRGRRNPGPRAGTRFFYGPPFASAASTSAPLSLITPRLRRDGGGPKDRGCRGARHRALLWGHDRQGEAGRFTTRTHCR
jgi:hypothetical protein